MTLEEIYQALGVQPGFLADSPYVPIFDGNPLFDMASEQQMLQNAPMSSLQEIVPQLQQMIETNANNPNFQQNASIPYAGQNNAGNLTSNPQSTSQPLMGSNQQASTAPDQIRTYIRAQLGDGSSPPSEAVAAKMFGQLKTMGATQDQIATAINQEYGTQFTANDVNSYISSMPSVQQAWGGNPQPQPMPQPMPQPQPQPQPNPGGEGSTPPSTPTFGSTPGDGAVGTSADYAAFAQGNADWKNTIQQGVFNNPNITLADGSTQTTTYGDLPDYRAYVENNPDVAAHFASGNTGFNDMESFGRWHYENYGRTEGRQMPKGSPADLGFLQPEVKVNLSPEEQAIYDANQRSRGTLASTAEGKLGDIQNTFANYDNVIHDEIYDPSQYVGTQGLFDFTKDPEGYLPGTDYQFGPKQKDFESYSKYSTQPGMEGFQDIRKDLVDREQYRFDRARGDLENDLLVRGLDPGSESWERRMDDLNRAENDFSLAATGQAAGIQGQIFGMEDQAKNTQMGAQGLFSGLEQSQIGQQSDIGSRQFDMEGQRRQQGMFEMDNAYSRGRDWRQNQINEELTYRNLPLNEYNALMTGTQIGLPNATPYQGGQFKAPDFVGAERENWNRDYIKDRDRRDRRDDLIKGTIQALGTAAGGGFGG